MQVRNNTTAYLICLPEQDSDINYELYPPSCPKVLSDGCIIFSFITHDTTYYNVKIFGQIFIAYQLCRNNYVSHAQLYKRIDRKKERKKKLKLISKFQRTKLETKTNFVHYSYKLDTIVNHTLHTILDRHVVNLRTVNV